MSDQKPSTNDILSKIRAKAASPSGDTPAAPSPPAAADAPAAAAPATPKGTSDILAAARSAAKPAGTADILAAAKKPAGTAPAVPAAGGAPPKSPADIMAAIRAKGASAAPAAAAPSAAAPKAAEAVKVDPAVASGLSAAEMIKAARSGSDGALAAPKVVLPSKPLPSKAAPVAAKAAEPEVARRSILGSIVATICTPVVIAWTSFIGALGVSGLGVARFMMPNVLVEPPTKFKIGPPNDYAPGTVSTKWQAQFNIWVVNAEVEGAPMIYALSTVCTHLGCTPNWLEGEQKFKCPCHGSGFYKNGVNFEGPAPRPLERVGIRLAEDGMLEVDKSVKFQKELGQWSNPACFVSV
ncbi:MAG: ubiquinol-cytochrome c reductase iron-sulfur subunit [Planctomycetota bacterium]